ncbi:MAG TPA: hypothetical protein VGO93_29375, partial [Candidatus Xenobia bacterium]
MLPQYKGESPEEVISQVRDLVETERIKGVRALLASVPANVMASSPELARWHYVLQPPFVRTRRG